MFGGSCGGRCIVFGGIVTFGGYDKLFIKAGSDELSTSGLLCWSFVLTEDGGVFEEDSEKKKSKFVNAMFYPS